MGISPWNRKISGKHVHKLGRRIISVEGFVDFRCKNAWAHQPSPEDPLEVARYTNEVASKSSLLIAVPLVKLYGSWSKGHLLSFLQALKSGAVYWDDTKTLMVPDAGQAALMEVLKLGLKYKVFKYEAMRMHAQAVKDLIASDNFDAAFALGETETRLLLSIKQSLAIVKTPPLESRCGMSFMSRWSDPPVIIGQSMTSSLCIILPRSFRKCI